MASTFSQKSRSSSSLRNSQLIITPITQTRIDNGILTVRYEEAQFSSPPIAVTIPPPTHLSIQSLTDVHPAFRTSFEYVENSKRKRDSGLANTANNSPCIEGLLSDIKASSLTKTTPFKIDEYLGIRINFDSSQSEHDQTSTLNKSLVPPPLLVYPASSEGERHRYTHAKSDETASKTDKDKFLSIKTKIPTDHCLGDDFLEQLSFSKRGSIMVDGRKAVEAHTRLGHGLRQPISSTSTDITDLSADTQRESQNIRSKYEFGLNHIDVKDGGTLISFNRHGLDVEHKKLNSHNMTTLTPPRSDSRLSIRNEFELAGGIEDWEDVNGCDIDRYGFINKVSSKSRSHTPSITQPRRTSTCPQLATGTHRKRREVNQISSVLMPTQQKSRRRIPTYTHHFKTPETYIKGFTMENKIRINTTCLPSSRYRRLINGAGNMLNFPHKLQDVSKIGERNSENLKIKEWKRADKWRKMAKIITPSPGSEGMKYEFDTRSTKLIQRTWKGIPDRWRAAAWYSFLRTSAKKQMKSTSEIEIINSFYRLLDESSADDIQIDIDVPRTINSHIMFRKRYRGGQRLLFRVLHCLSLFFPRTGYVQGMASLAATLLCYYDEEKAFVMLVRLWTLRGMDKLYDPGFQGLIDALREFQANWIDNRAVSKKLEDLNIEPTAYGTRWYLTLFNLSVPFSAQLRVWDVFMLLGDIVPNSERVFGDGLTILHATSAALVDATSEVLLNSDFDTAMKTLTGWIPIKDDELLMKVARAEWKLHKKKDNVLRLPNPHTL